MSDTHPPLLAADHDALVEGLGGPGRAAAVARALRAGQRPEEATGDVGARTLRALARRFRFAPPAVVEEHASDDGTRKVVLGLADGELIETVLIPTKGRTTLCVSSQVGCTRGCQFCLTALMGLRRQLTRDEILSQLWWGRRLARKHWLPEIRNVVFMGMGEPLDNWREVSAALHQMTDSRLHGVAPKHVTLSTVAPTARAVRQLGQVPARLAWSLHAADQGLRRKLIPSPQDDLVAIRDAWAALLAERGDALFVEVTLMSGRNDRLEDAAALVEFLAPLGADTRVNLLPVNPGREGIAAPSLAHCEEFAAHLRAAGLFTMLRRPRGQAAQAACGQLVQAQTR